MKVNMSRREMLLGSLAMVGGAGIGGCRTPGAGGTDPNLTAFLSDIHVSGPGIKGIWGEQPMYQNAYFRKAVDRVLALPVRPAKAVFFGDIALWHGYRADYETSAPEMKRLEAAGIEVFITTGNHDHREPLMSVYPKQRELTPVAGRTVSVIDLGYADLLLMDTLDETEPKEGGNNRVGGAMDDGQWAWLEREAKAWKRPFFVGAHHAPRDLNGRKACRLLAPIPNFAGWIHGHDHTWSKQWFAESYASRRVCREVALPSTGWWGDIGFALMRTEPGRAMLSLEQDDFYFPGPLKEGEARPPLWDEILRENRGESCTFVFA